MKDKNHTCKFQRIHGPKSVTTVILNNFQDACSAKAVQNLRVLMFAATLGDVQCIAHVILYRCWELTKTFETCTDPNYRLERWITGHGNHNIVISLYSQS